MDYAIPVKDVEKYQKLSGYFLVDIKVLFIITYVYISAVNLISSTANNEATQDTQAPIHFNVTSRSEHTNVNVSSIDDAVLWNCRQHSFTSNYYVTLYWMLLAVFSVTLTFYLVSKLIALWNISNSDSLTDLWHMAVMQQLKKLMKTGNYTPEDAEQLAECYQDLLDKEIPKDFYNIVKTLTIVNRRKTLPYFSLLLLTSAMVFGALSYDLHLLSCISGIPEDSISYNEITQTVEIRFSSSVTAYQIAAVFITSFLLSSIIFLALLFYIATKKTVHIMEVKVQDKIDIKVKSKTLPETATL